jgi:hypothetical protein
VADPIGWAAGAAITGAMMLASINPYICRTNPIIRTSIHNTPTAINDPVLKIMKKDKRRTTAIPIGRAADPAVAADFVAAGGA